MTDKRNDSGGLTVRLARADEVAWYNALMKEHHSLGVAASGRVLRYVAEAGGVYKACGFTAVGSTAGYGRSRGRDYYAYHGQPKTCWLRELAPGGIAALAAGFDAPVLAGHRAPDFNRLQVSGDRGLLGYLAQVADHRKAKGIRHDLAAIMVVIVVARLCGANSVY